MGSHQWTRVRTTGAIVRVRGLHTFDAQSFLRLNTVSRKWSCPECGKKGGPSDLRIDSFLKRCVDIMRERGLHKATRVEMDKDGRWRPREEVARRRWMRRNRYGTRRRSPERRLRGSSTPPTRVPRA